MAILFYFEQIFPNKRRFLFLEKKPSIRFLLLIKEDQTSKKADALTHPPLLHNLIIKET